MAREITRAGFMELTGIEVTEEIGGITLVGWQKGHNVVLGSFIFVEAPGELQEVQWLEEHFNPDETQFDARRHR